MPKSVPATVREVAVAAGPATRTSLVKADVGIAAVQIGQTMSFVIKLPPREVAARLPLSAVMQEQGQTAVWLLDTATATVQVQPIVAAGADGNTVFVAGGLSLHQPVVVAGVHTLTRARKTKLYDAAVKVAAAPGTAPKLRAPAGLANHRIPRNPQPCEAAASGAAGTVPGAVSRRGIEAVQVRQWADQAKEILRANASMRGVNDNCNEQINMLRLEVDRDQARALGVTSQTNAQDSRVILSGSNSGQYREGDKLIDIVLRQPLEERNAITDLGNTCMPTASGRSVPLTQIAKVGFSWGRACCCAKAATTQSPSKATWLKACRAPLPPRRWGRSFRRWRRRCRPATRCRSPTRWKQAARGSVRCWPTCRTWRSSCSHG